MTISRVTSNVDLFSPLRLVVPAHGQASGRQAPPNADNSNAVARHSRQNAGLNLELEDRQRSRRWEAEEEGKVVPFEQPAAEWADQQSREGGTAEEIPVLLDLGSARRDPQLGQVARLYSRSGRSVGASSGMVGTMLNAVA